MEQAGKTQLALRVPQGGSRLLAGGFFFAFALMFLLLPSQHYTAVDGSVRSLDVLHHPEVLFGGNNHLLYPFWVLLWSRLTTAVGIRAASGFEFVRVVESMNSLLAAATIAVLYRLLSRVADWRFASLGTLLFGFSTALVRHATNAAEPMAGLFFAVLGMSLLVLGLEREQRALWIAAGASFALALASYQAMGAVAGAGAFVTVWSAARRHDAVRFARARLLWISLAGLVGICGIYAPVYAFQAVPVHKMPSQFFSLSGSEIYGGFSFSHLVNLPFGLIRNLYGGVPPGYAGIRSLLSHSGRAFWIPAVLAGLALLAVVAFLVGKALRALLERQPAVIPAAALAAGALLIFPLLDWDPTYDKLWLLPLACMACVVSVSFYPGALASGQRKVLAGLLLVLLGAEIGVNVPQMVTSHVTPAPHLAEAEAMSRLVGPHDWVVISFDDVSILWATFWGYDARTLLLPASTAGKAADWLDAAKQACRQGDGRILFVGVLDQDRKTWDDFLGRRVEIPFSLLDSYRSARILLSFSFGKSVVTLREYRP